MSIEVQTSVNELIERANDAIAKMSSKNEHRQLIYALAMGLSQLSQMLTAEREKKSFSIRRVDEAEKA